MPATETIQAILGALRAGFDSRYARLIQDCVAAPSYAAFVVSPLNSLAKYQELLNYALSSPGKRLRPAAVALGYVGGMVSQTPDCVSGEWIENLCARHPGLGLLQAAFETLHTYSLVHDDLPAMDNDELRRGLPTVHHKYGEASGILAGDALNSLAFQFLAQIRARRRWQLVITAEFHHAAGLGGMVLGQYMDILYTGQTAAAGPKPLSYIHYHKTAALLAAAFMCGWFLARSDGGDKKGLRCYKSFPQPLQTADTAFRQSMLPRIIRLRRFFTKIGYLFQLTDDILDATGTSAQIGKTPGKDAGKKLTILSHLGLDEARLRVAQIAAALRTEISDIDLNSAAHSPMIGLIELIRSRDK